jgi:hypothetical protein
MNVPAVQNLPPDAQKNTTERTVNQAMGRPGCRWRPGTRIVEGTSGARVCHHDGYREIVTRYDRAGGLLTFYWRCESCGVLLQEADRRRYRPRFAPLPQASYFPKPDRR